MRLLKLFTALLLFSAITVSSTQAQLTVDIGTIKTTDRATAVSFAVSYARSIDSLWRTRENYVAGKSSMFTFNPEFNVRFGTADAFSSIQAKLVGTFTKFKLTDFNGLKVPDFRQPMHIFPVGIGVESNSSFTIMNAIGEVGYTPYYQSETGENNSAFRRSSIGLYLQAGYKFKGDSTSTPIFGGAKDESYEQFNSTIVRVKGHADIDTKSLLKFQGLDFGLAGTADVWYDLRNAKFYHRIQASGRFYLANGSFINMLYAKGAGAPTFNTGSEYGLGYQLKF